MPHLKVTNLDLSMILPHMQKVYNFTVPAGACMGVSGPSGIGKSVLLKAIADMLNHQGEIFLDDLESRSVPAPKWRKLVALLPAESQWWSHSVGEHFDGFDAPLFAHFGFDADVMHWQISRLSSGEKQRLAIIRVLMNRPQALLLDEPTANLDQGNRLATEELIGDYQQTRQVPVMWISHDKEQLERVSQLNLSVTRDNYEVC